MCVGPIPWMWPQSERPARIVTMGEWISLIAPLSDANHFLRRAHELSAKIGPHQPETAIYARACIIFAWSAVEAIVLLELRRIRSSGQKKQFPKSLAGRVQLLMHDRNAPFDDAQFTRLRNYRNIIAHPPHTPVYTAPPPDWAQEHFDYCVDLCRMLYLQALKF
jgi:hypothetical protein